MYQSKLETKVLPSLAANQASVIRYKYKTNGTPSDIGEILAKRNKKVVMYIVSRYSFKWKPSSRSIDLHERNQYLFKEQ